MPAMFSGTAMLSLMSVMFSQKPIARFSRFGVVLTFLALISGCSSNSSDSRYELHQDAAPDEAFDMSKIKELYPVYEPPSRAGNKSPYTVWGKSYSVMPTSKGYKAEGIASWYGKKFHGYHTSNGEIYDMYQLSAAHKSLPLPSYVLVTHLGNGRQVLVRVNDRGPFHDGRVIDLSYAAAARLDMLGSGTAPVRIEAIDPVTWKGGMNLAVNQLQPPLLVQVAALSKSSSAQQLGSQLERATGHKMTIVTATINGRLLHKVQLGPVKSRSDLQSLIDQLANNGFVRPIIIPFDH